MANILFKRGLHSALPTTAVDGAFYLTTDSHRLYAGIGTELVDLNKYIRTVPTLTELKTWTDMQLGDFVYIQGGNILAVYQNTGSKNEWVQINQNTDTKNSSVVFTGSGAADEATLKITINDSDTGKVEDTIKFIGTKGIDTSIDAEGNITIQGCTYTASGALEANTFTVSLTSSDEAEAPSSNVKLVSGSNVNFTSPADDTLQISVPNMGLAPSGHTFTANAAGGATVKILDNNAGSATATLADGSLFYKVGAGETKTTVQNQGELPVYTIEEINKKFNDLNPMKYLGTVNSASALSGKTGVQVGDTYMASAPFNIKTVPGLADQDKTCKIGDLFIATGEEVNGVLTSVVWTYVPAGDDSQTDTLYHGSVDAAEHKLSILDSNLATVAGVDIDVDGKITASSVAYDLANGGKGLKTTLGHAAPGADDAAKKKTGSALDGVYTFTAVTGEVVDATGHVAEYTTQAITVPKANFKSTTAAADAGVATVTTVLGDTANGTLGSTAFSIDASNADSLNVTATGNTITMKLEWGSF